MLYIALYEPEIPPNTGNIIRLCANTGAALHLIGRLGFALDDKNLRRAGLDYHDMANVFQYKDFAAWQKKIAPSRIIACSTKGKTLYTDINYQKDDVLLFGPETRGLPQQILKTIPGEHVVRIPMAFGSRSLNLSNAAAIILYEALRQIGFEHLK